MKSVDSLTEKDLEDLYRKEADRSISAAESVLLVDYLDKYDKNWKVADQKIASYRNTKEQGNSKQSDSSNEHH